MSIFKKVWSVAKTTTKVARIVAVNLIPVVATFIPRWRWLRAVPLVASAIDAVESTITHKESGMNPLEKAIRDLADLANALKDGAQVSDIGEVIGLLTSAPEGYKAFAEADLESKVAMAKETFDNICGTEPDALIGPNGSLIKVDIPLVDDEVATDLLAAAVEAAVRAKYGPN